MKKLLIFFVALFSIVGTMPGNAVSQRTATVRAQKTKRSIMELPIIERAILIIKRFETLHTLKNLPYCGYGHRIWPGENLPRHRALTEFPDDKRTVLYFDTEQSPYHCQKVIRRAIELADLPTDRHPDNLFFSQLRAQVPDTRLEIIDRAIATTPNVGLVVIDGIRDLMFDINNATESSRLINKLMEWTDNNQIHVHTVLHLNKSDDNVRGHVGTELNNKAETVLQVSKSATDDEVTEVSASCIRAMDFSPGQIL